MRTSPARLAAQLNARSLRLRIKRPFTRVPKRDIGTRAHYIELPRQLWDRIVLLLFTCCLLTFFHALFGFGDVDKDFRVLNHTFVHSPMHSSPWNQYSVVANEGQMVRAPSVTRVTVNWHGDYELLPSTTFASVSPASIPQDAFPEPTPTLVSAERRRALDNERPYTLTRIEIPANTPSTLYTFPYDSFRLVFEDSADGAERNGPYPVAGPPRTARTRHFGGCFPGEACQ